MKNILGWVAIIGLGIVIYTGYNFAKKQKVIVSKEKK